MTWLDLAVAGAALVACTLLLSVFAWIGRVWRQEQASNPYLTGRKPCSLCAVEPAVSRGHCPRCRATVRRQAELRKCSCARQRARTAS